MGVEKCTDPSHIVDPCFSFPQGYLKKEMLQYHKSWDWLMPVVEKIGTMYEQYPKEVNYVRSYGIMTQIHKIYKAVVEFIKWYHTSK